MWWRSPNCRSRFFVDVPCGGGRPDEVIEVDWRVRLVAVKVCVIFVGVMWALAAWLGA